MYVFAKFIYNEYIRPYFLSHIVSTIFASAPPPSSRSARVKMQILYVNQHPVTSQPHLKVEMLYMHPRFEALNHFLTPMLKTLKQISNTDGKQKRGKEYICKWG